MNVRAAVEGVDSSGHLVLREWHSAMSGRPLPRPFVGSSTTGFHTAPPQGAQVLLLYESGAIPYPGAVVSADDGARTLKAQSAGESFILGPRGEVLSYATASGPTVLYQNADNTLSIQVDPATSRVNIFASGGLYVNGVAVAVP